MAEYIERDVAIEVALSCTDAFEPIAVDTTVKNVVSKLRNIPYADVQPVKHGRWKWSEGGQCSECGFHNSNFGYNYCPNCGTKMDGDKNG